MIRVGLSLEEQTIQPGNRLLPAFNTTAGTEMIIDKKSITVHLSGGVAVDIVNVFTRFFRSTVADLITKNVVE